MRLTAYTDYSLRVLIYLGLERGRLATISEIATAYDISENHLMKIVHNLGKAGYIDTVRGRGGGLRLAGKPNEINLGVVVRHTESDFSLVDCFDQTRDSDCALNPSCQLQAIFRKALEAFLNVLDEYTLADVLQNRSRLKRLLGINLSTPDSR